MTTDDVIKLFGGRSKVAVITGCRPNAVTQWRYAGVPFKVWPALITKAASLGIEGVTFETLEGTRPRSGAPVPEAAA